MAFQFNDTIDNVYKKLYKLTLCLLIVATILNIWLWQYPIYLVSKSGEWIEVNCKIIETVRTRKGISFIYKYQYEYKEKIYESKRATFWSDGTKFVLKLGDNIKGLMDPKDPGNCVLFPKWRPENNMGFALNLTVIISLVVAILLYYLYKNNAQQGDAPEPDSCRSCLSDTTSRPGDL